jgi:hypothetical protein
MAIGAGFVTDVFAGFALNRARETDAEDPKEPPPQQKRAEIVPVTKNEMRYIEPVVENAESSIAFSGEGTGVIGSIELLEKTRRRANYVVKIVNDTPEMLFCSTAAEHGRDRSALQPESFVVESRAASAMIVEVPLRLWKPFGRVLVTLRNSTMHCGLSATVPRSPLLVPALVLLGALFLAVAAWTGFTASSPRISAYAVPTTTLAGSAVRAEYAVRGLGSGTYDVVAIGKNRDIASGTISNGSGYFTFNTPVRPDRYRITLAMRGPLGIAAEAQVLQTVAAKVSNGNANSAQLVRSFEVEDAVVQSGKPIVVRYFASGTGQLRLLDTSQIPVVSHPADKSGVTQMKAPDVQRDTPFRLELTMHQGNSSQTASVGILVQPANQLTTISGEEISSDTDLAKISAQDMAAASAASNSINASKLFKLYPSHPAGGSTIRVGILQKVANLRLTLQDSRGVPLNIQTVAPAAKRVSFALPPVGVDSNFLLIANFERGTSAHTVILPFVVYVR